MVLEPPIATRGGRVRRRQPRWALAVAALAAMVPACTSDDEPGPGSATAPNIVVILTDDLATSDLEAMPNVRRLLADEGMSFERFYVSTSLCCPSRATLLRGQYAHNTGVENNGPVDGGFETFLSRGLERSTVGTWLQDAGYRTAFIGKYMNGYPIATDDTHVPAGWDDWVSGPAGGLYQQFDYTLNDNGELRSYGNDPEDYGTDVLVDHSVRFMRASSGTPFFLYLNVAAPHLPATPAPQDADLFPDARVARTPAFDEADVSDKPEWVQRLPAVSAAQAAENDAAHRLRLQSLQAVDRGVATLLDELERRGQLERTYVVFSSDNGYHLGQHRLLPGKTTAYETDINVPLLVRGPGIRPASSSAALLGNTDVAPTLAALAEAQVPDFVDGRSFASLLGDPSAPWPRRSFLLERLSFTSRFATAGDAADADGGASLAEEELPLGRAPRYVGLRTDRYLYVEYETGERELYDMEADPGQLDNLAGSEKMAPVLGALAARLVAFEGCEASGCRAAEDEPIGPTS